MFKGVKSEFFLLFWLYLLKFSFYSIDFNFFLSLDKSNSIELTNICRFIAKKNHRTHENQIQQQTTEIFNQFLPVFSLFLV